MFYLSSFDGEPIDIENLPVIRLAFRPSGLGTYRDVYGKESDIRAIVGKVVYAKPYDEVRDWYRTDGMPQGYRSQEWNAHRFEIVTEKAMATA